MRKWLSGAGPAHGPYEARFQGRLTSKIRRIPSTCRERLPIVLIAMTDHHMLCGRVRGSSDVSLLFHLEMLSAAL